MFAPLRRNLSLVGRVLEAQSGAPSFPWQSDNSHRATHEADGDFCVGDLMHHPSHTKTRTRRSRLHGLHGSSRLYNDCMRLCQLYIVTATGYYTAVQGARPVQDLELLHRMIPYIEAVRPGRGRYYELHVAHVTEDWIPDDVSHGAMVKLQEKLKAQLP